MNAVYQVKHGYYHDGSQIVGTYASLNSSLLVADRLRVTHEQSMNQWEGDETSHPKMNYSKSEEGFYWTDNRNDYFVYILVLTVQP